MSYKVLRDGNGSSLIRVIGLGDYMPLKDHQAMVTKCEEKSKAIFDIMAERDALAAKLQKIDDAWMAAGCWPDTVEEKQALASAINAAPQQCLAEIKAEAGRAGFLEGVRQMCDNEIGMLGHDAESCANHYAARVRLGFEPGTWLKDSNVNGGKRQGGEK